MIMNNLFLHAFFFFFLKYENQETKTKQNKTKQNRNTFSNMVKTIPFVLATSAMLSSAAALQPALRGNHPMMHLPMHQHNHHMMHMHQHNGHHHDVKLQWWWDNDDNEDKQEEEEEKEEEEESEEEEEEKDGGFKWPVSIIIFLSSNLMIVD